LEVSPSFTPATFELGMTRTQQPGTNADASTATLFGKRQRFLTLLGSSLENPRLGQESWDRGHKLWLWPTLGLAAENNPARPIG
jgi:hypothetical protein